MPRQQSGAGPVNVLLCDQFVDSDPNAACRAGKSLPGPSGLSRNQYRQPEPAAAPQVCDGAGSKYRRSQ